MSIALKHPLQGLKDLEQFSHIFVPLLLVLFDLIW